MFDMLLQVLESRRNALLQKIGSDSNQTTSVVNRCHNKYADTLHSANRNVDRALQLESDDNTISFLKQSRPLIDEMMVIHDDMDIRPPPIQPLSIQKYGLDLKPLADIVSHIDFNENQSK